MKLFGIEVRAIRKPSNGAVAEAVGRPYVGNISMLGGYLRYGATDRNWRTEAGQLESNSTVAIALQRVAQKIAQTQLQVKKTNKDGSVVFIRNEQLMPWTQPLQGLTQATLLKSVGCSMLAYGNGYLLKRRSKVGFLVGLAPIMPWQVTPKSDVHIDGTPNNGSELITRYKITPYGGGSEFYVAPSEVVHFRYGMVDPYNPALGLSALMSCLRQVVSDNEANNYFATLMTNMGIPGVVISPKADNVVEPTQEQRKGMRERWQSFTRDRRGQMLDLPGAFEIQKVAMSPTDLKAIEQKVHSMTEILGAMGIDPMVLGLPSDSKTYNNMREARESFIEDTILPLLSDIAMTLDTMFIVEGLKLQDDEELAFNHTVYRELDEDVTVQHERATNSFKAGGSTRGEYRKALGFETDLDDPRTFFDIQSQSPLPTTRKYTMEQQRALERIQLGE